VLGSELGKQSDDEVRLLTRASRRVVVLGQKTSQTPFRA
jgi:hypothetical protein